MMKKVPNEQLRRMIEVDMSEVERGVAIPILVKGRIEQYIHHYGTDVFIAAYVHRYNEVVRNGE